MAALAADLNISVVENSTVEIGVPAIADTFYKGGLVFYLAAGGNVTNVPVDSGGLTCLGIVLKQQTIATAGNLLQVCIRGYVWTPISTTGAAADVMSLAYVDDSGGNLTDNPVDLINDTPAGDTALAAEDIVCARIVRVTSTDMLLAFDVAGVTGFSVLATGAACLA